LKKSSVFGKVYKYFTFERVRSWWAVAMAQKIIPRKCGGKMKISELLTNSNKRGFGVSEHPQTVQGGK